ncbi:MAG: protein-L-isoaspartate O-methyltransferase [Candidatus Devosia symbiotica]|nr:protein-L-isoaspartate O-methyltransferase [Candidatus Devosia symbiotica]
MTRFEQLRANMVDNQLRTSGVTARSLLAEMAKLPRERFVPADRQSVAYIDDIHWLGQGTRRRFIMAPAILAKLLQLAEITPDSTVLDIGAATGYGTAVMAGLASSVVGLEADADLAAAATTTLKELGIANASIVVGDIAALGRARFDVIIVQGALDSVPDAMFEALNEGGRLVALIRSGSVSVANVFVKTGKAIAARGEFNASLPALDQVQPAPEFVF